MEAPGVQAWWPHPKSASLHIFPGPTAPGTINVWLKKPSSQKEGPEIQHYLRSKTKTILLAHHIWVPRVPKLIIPHGTGDN